MSIWPFKRKSPPVTEPPAPTERGVFSTDKPPPGKARQVIAEFYRSVAAQPYFAANTQDNVSNGIASFKQVAASVPDELLGWYAGQRFIGYQTCALLMQHWLIDKACSMPARDAIRHGFEIQAYQDSKPLTDEQTTDITERIKRADRRHHLNKNMQEYIRMGRVFGIRVAFFKFRGATPDYYDKPFNPDGIQPGTYEGIVQVDPYWCVPLLSTESASDPSSMHFYEPEWWIIRGQRYHRSHLCIFRNGDVPDLIKPLYAYGGIPTPQRIMERVYAAERTANEGPQLAMSKRLTVQNTALADAWANQEAFVEKMQWFAMTRDNFGIKLVDNEDTVQQFDTSLADLDAVIMTQYQIVAAAADVPAVELLNTTPKGFNATGEYEAASYRKGLESIQADDLTELVQRHHICVMRSEIEPALKLTPGSVRIEIDWLPLDSPTAKEYAEINKINADTDAVLIATGAVDATDVRNRLRGDKNSGYADLDEFDTPNDEETGDPLAEFGLSGSSAQNPPSPEA